VDSACLKLSLATLIVDRRDHKNFVRRRDTTKMEGEREILSVPSLLMCPLSYDRMQDPVILIPSGNTYDCELICKSLLRHPHLDPSSGVRYVSKLQYCDNLAVRQLLMETYGDKAFKKYDDSGFQTRYDKAWNSGNAGAAAARARAALVAVIQNVERERDVHRWTHNRVMLAIFGFDGLKVGADGTMVHEPGDFIMAFLFLLCCVFFCYMFVWKLHLHGMARWFTPPSILSSSTTLLPSATSSRGCCMSVVRNCVLVVDDSA
jgi:hypothetical protein